MPTSKKRLNVTLSPDMAVFLKKIALRDHVPEATKAAELLARAMEMEEDEYFSRVADERASSPKQSWLSHDEFWSKVS